ncbi:hypothetical protein ACS0TY_007985 [Phlomoides rotata]
MAEVIAQELGDNKEMTTTDKKKGPTKIGGEYKPPGNKRSFAESTKMQENLKKVLSISIDSLYDEVKNRGWLSAPRKIMQERSKLNKWKYCAYHGDIGHYTSKCRDLMRQLWKYYEDGKLAEFVKKPPAPRATARKRNEDDEEDQDEDLRNKIDRKKQKTPPMSEGSQPREILMLQPDLGLVGGCNEGGVLVSTSKRKRKVVVRELDHVDTRVGLPPREVQTYPLTFTDDDLKGILMPHNDPLVISLNIMGTKVHRLLVDTGSYANIIFQTTLDKLGNYESYLQPCNHRILGFGDDVFVPEGIIRLAVKFVSTEDPEHRLTRMLYFLVIDQASTYNGFLSRPFLHEFQAAVSTYYYCVKFPTPNGTTTLQGDHKKARECFLSLSPTVQTRVSVLERDLIECLRGRDQQVTKLSERS